MLGSVLIGLPAGARALTPFATVCDAARRGALPEDNGAPAWLGSPLVAWGAVALAAGELGGDKLHGAPDRIVAAGLIARVVGAGLAGAALAPRRQARLGALLAASTAVASAYVTFAGRRAAMRRFGQMRSGLVEDALAIALSQLVVRTART